MREERREVGREENWERTMMCVAMLEWLRLHRGSRVHLRVSTVCSGRQCLCRPWQALGGAVVLIGLEEEEEEESPEGLMGLLD